MVSMSNTVQVVWEDGVKDAWGGDVLLRVVRDGWDNLRVQEYDLG